MRQNPPGLVTPTFRVGESIEPILSIGTSDRPPFGFNYPVIPVGSLDDHGGIVGARPGAGGIDRDIKADSTLIYNAGVERRLLKQIVAGITYTGSYTWNGLFGSDFNRFSGDLLDGSLDCTQPQLRADVLRAECQQDLLQRDHVLGPPGHRAQQLPWRTTRSRKWRTTARQAPASIVILIATPTAHNLSRYRAPADWDVRHRLAFAESYMLPEPSGSGPLEVHPRRMAEDHRDRHPADRSPFTVFTDAPFAPILGPTGAVVGLTPASGDYNADGVNFDFPNAPTNVPDSFDRQDYIDGVFQAASFTQPAPGQEGTLAGAHTEIPGSSTST